MKCSECGAEYVQRCARCHQKSGVSFMSTDISLAERILKKARRQIATQAAVEAARRRIHGD